jgi:hypothetical protein
MNMAPSSILDHGLPAGFMSRTERRQWGGLVLHLATRVDQIAFELFAAVDQGRYSKHAEDLRRLQPTPSELLAAARWARQHDPSDGFGEILTKALAEFGAVDDGAL